MGLTGCASIVASAERSAHWEALNIAGTAYSAVYRDGIPQAPGIYQVVVTKPGKADFYRAGRLVGTGDFRTVAGQRDSIRIEVSPNARVTVVGQ